MAEAALSFAVRKLGELAIQKFGFLQDIEEQVRWLRDELERMQSILKDAAEKQASDERVRKWISQIREVAQDAEDAIESFTLKVDYPRSSGGQLKKLFGFPKHLSHLDRIGKKIGSIRSRLEAIDRSRERYGIQNLGEGMALSRRSEEVEWRRRLAHWQRDKQVVGLEEDVELLLEKAVLERREGLSIASIIGIGGIGKSTLARIVYNHAAVGYAFERCAWVCVSSEFRPREIMKELMLQLLEPTEDQLNVLETMEKLELPILQQMLHERLQGKRYFIVLDDVWEEAHWEALSSAFPDDEDKASRVLLTSRNRVITKYARYVHEMKFLDPDKSWELFLKTAFTENSKGKCPEDLEYIGREILKKCQGLPLAIIVVGGVLVNQRQSESEWEKVLKGIHSHLGRSGSIVSAILELSYHNLPPLLKSCFLCLGFFKENASIRVEKLVQVWISEGLVPQETGEGMMEEIARSYLDELINRNMIQIKDMRIDSRIKTCLIHDLIRELSITKAKEEIGFEILREEGSSQSLDKPRHCAIYCGRTRFLPSSKQNKRIRSLFFHGTIQVDCRSSYWKSFELLRILDFEDLGLENLHDGIGKLIGLRYLGLRNNYIVKLPNSFGDLKKLEVLDIAKNYFIEVPNILWKMKSLRHLYMSDITCKTPLKLHTLKNLQTVTYISMAHWTTEHLMEMSGLRKLGIELNADSDISELFTSLATLENLTCLSLVWNYYKSMSFLDGLGHLHRVTQLKLHGWLAALPNANNFPPNLSYLSLVETSLKYDPMPILEKLPKLLYLKLEFAYDGSNMRISHGGFPKLRVLTLRRLWHLSNIQLGKDALPELKRLEIYKCSDLTSLPKELAFISNLQELKILTTTEIAYKLRGGNSEIFFNIPSLDLTVVPSRRLWYC